MSGRVLIVDPVVTTRIVLKVKLAAAYFAVSHAATMREALIEVDRSSPDVVLCEWELADGDADALQKRLRARGIPVIALLPGLSAQDRIIALEAGLGDVISRPYEDRTLLARVRNLLRARTVREELRLRGDTSAALGFAEQSAEFHLPAKVGVIAETPKQGADWKEALSQAMEHSVSILTPADLLADARTTNSYDALVVGISGQRAQKRLDLVSSLRARPETRHCAILAVSPAETCQMAVTALDTGAGDIMVAGFEAKEAALRLVRLIKRRCEDRALRRSVKAGLEAAVTDQLTGLYNRRYALPHLERMATCAARNQRPFAIMVLDLDHFKSVNDTYGHAVGDTVLSEFASRLRSNLRSVDLVARIGGEEFLVAMPDTRLTSAARAAARLCKLTKARPFATSHVARGVAVSVSVGLALGGATQFGSAARSIEALLSDADAALYDAKEAGRNMVRVSRSAAA